MSKTFVPIAARPAPIKMEGFVPWLRSNLFSSVGNSLVSLIVLALLLWAASGIAQWGIIHAVTAAEPDACQAARGVGACWGVIREKGRIILLGRYPQPEHWRAELADRKSVV